MQVKRLHPKPGLRPRPNRLPSRLDLLRSTTTSNTIAMHTIDGKGDTTISGDGTVIVGTGDRHVHFADPIAYKSASGHDDTHHISCIFSSVL